MISNTSSQSECDNTEEQSPWNCTKSFKPNETCYFDYCTFGNSCHCDTFIPGNNHNSMSILCDWHTACMDSKIYCPSYDINSCKLYIDPSGTSVTRVNIYVPNDYKYGYLQLLNKEQMNYNPEFAITTNCMDETNKTKIISQTNITFDGWYKCSNTDCCPWSLELSLNEPDTAYNISCNITDCNNKFIDGSLATVLDIDCDGRDNCINTTILCPYNGSCNIDCLDYHSCWGMTINYQPYNPLLPTTQDIPEYYSGSHISIYCAYDNSCEDMIINTENAQSLTLICNNKDNHYDHHEGICDNLHINANNVDTLHVLCHNDLACVNINVEGNNVNEGVLYARSKDTSAWYNSVFRASNATFVEIDCESSELFYSACADSDYYVPSTDGFVLNCFGYGCYQMGNIHVEQDISLAAVNYNGCGYCGSVINCTSDLNIICDGKRVCNVSNWNNMQLLTEDIVYNTGGHCGCNQLYVNAMNAFENNQTVCKERLTFDPPAIDENHGKSWVAVLAGIGCVAFFVNYCIFSLLLST